MVFDLATLLVASGLRLAENLILGWVKAGRSEVKVTEVDASIARGAQAEAERLRVRVDDLERETRRMMEQLVAASPELSYAKPRFSSKLTIDYNPRDPASSKNLLAALHSRVEELMPTERLAESRDATSSDLETIGLAELQDDQSEAGTATISVVPAESHAATRSRQMLDDLQSRVKSRESNRR